MQGWLLLQAEDAHPPPGSTHSWLSFRRSPLLHRAQRGGNQCPGGLDANSQCWDLRAAGRRRTDEREAAGPKAKQKMELRSTAC